MTDPQAHPGTVHLRLTRPGRIAPDVAAGLLEAAYWLGTEIAPGQPKMRRYLTDLALPIRAGRPRTVFRKAAFVDIGPPEPTEDGLKVAIGWRSATMAPLFPVFAGRLEVDPGGLLLEGWYAPPGGEAGRIIDRAFLNVAARGTARWFLDHVGAVLEAGRPLPEGLQEPQSAR